MRATLSNGTPFVGDPVNYDQITWQVLAATAGAYCQALIDPGTPNVSEMTTITFEPGKANKATTNLPVNKQRGQTVPWQANCSYRGRIQYVSGTMHWG